MNIVIIIISTLLSAGIAYIIYTYFLGYIVNYLKETSNKNYFLEKRTYSDNKVKYYIVLEYSLLFFTFKEDINSFLTLEAAKKNALLLSKHKKVDVKILSI